ncbi:MAG: NAD(P)-dependent alcohol dehydrogenase [Bacteroidetes bacterium]|nr:MAG: NAD(P)-dependent alcohol dehydrogenase [Bacteroidota bacterium]
MKAIVCTQYGPPEVLQIRELPKPIPKENQVLIKIMASAVNSGDVRVRSFDVQGIMRLVMRIVLGVSKPRQPILGNVFSGIIESTGAKVRQFKVGDRVFGMTGLKLSTNAEFIAVDQNSAVLQMPVNASFNEAAAIVFGGQTALHFLDKAKITRMSNPKVLIIGATGSVGTAAVQIADHYKSDITAVCSSEGEALLSELGVKKRVLYDKENFANLKSKFDIIFDAVGSTSKKHCRHLLSENGTYVSVRIGYAAESLRQLERLKHMFEVGELNATIDKVYSMDNIVEAHRYVETGRKKGNVVLKIGKTY